ncbi:MAG: ATP-binding protein [Bacteroidales bacterium]|nr:ATP-binding protein [Bacteroidales bacterium]
MIFTDIDELQKNYLFSKKKKDELESKMQYKLREITKKLSVSEKILKIFKAIYINYYKQLLKQGVDDEFLKALQSKIKHLNLGQDDDNLIIEKNDIYDLLTEIKTLCDNTIADNDVEFEIIKKENVTDSVWLDKAKILFVVESILKNCIDNTFDFSNVVFTVYNKVNCLHFSISDNGKKLTEEQTETFLYSQNSKSFDGRNSSLELVLANQYILLHGGQISVLNNKTEGVTFIFSLNECCKPD